LLQEERVGFGVIDAQPTVADTTSVGPWDLTSTQRTKALVSLVVVLGLLAGLGVGLDRVTSSSRKVLPIASAVPFPREITDDFAARPGPGLGAAPTGQHWGSARGVWGVSGDGAGVVTMAPLGSALALVRVGRGPGSIAVTAQTMTKGMGIAFRCRSLLDCWNITAVPELGTWKITKIAAAVPTEMGNLGTVPVASGTRIRVDNGVNGFDVFIDDTLVKHVDDPSINDAGSAGLVVDPEPGATTARFTKFAASQVNIVGPDAPVHDAFDRPDGSLGKTPTGQAWKVDSGSWGVRGQEAVLNSPPTAAANIATVDIGRTAGWVQVTATTAPDGVGVVFRYQDPKNYWRIVAVPGYGTFNVFKVINGVETRVGATGLTTVNTIDVGANKVGVNVNIGIRMRGEDFTFFIDGFETVTMHSTELIKAHRAGIVVASDKGKDARFAGFAAGPLTLAGAQS
jgi:hypothetical protein